MKISAIKNAIDKVYSDLSKEIYKPAWVTPQASETWSQMGSRYLKTGAYLYGAFLLSSSFNIMTYFREPSEIAFLRNFYNNLENHNTDRDFTDAELFDFYQKFYLLPVKKSTPKELRFEALREEVKQALGGSHYHLYRLEKLKAEDQLSLENFSDVVSNSKTVSNFSHQELFDLYLNFFTLDRNMKISAESWHGLRGDLRKRLGNSDHNIMLLDNLRRQDKLSLESFITIITNPNPITDEQSAQNAMSALDLLKNIFDVQTSLIRALPVIQATGSDEEKQKVVQGINTAGGILSTIGKLDHALLVGRSWPSMKGLFKPEEEKQRAPTLTIVIEGTAEQNSDQVSTAPKLNKSGR